MAAVVGRWVNFYRERVDLDKGSVDGAANVGEGGEFLEGLGGFAEAAAASGDLDELTV